MDRGAVGAARVSRDGSEARREKAAEPFMRAPSKQGAAGTEDAGEFPTTRPYAAGSADRLRATRVSANAKRNPR